VVRKIIIHKRAEKVLFRLPRDLLARVRASINDLAYALRPEGCIKLAGYFNFYRIRVGDWRISYAIEDEKLIIHVLEGSPRGDAYRTLNRNELVLFNQLLTSQIMGFWGDL
jgi:mRNA interferase RelE/StbE